MISDAPWIREAETDGVGYDAPTEREYRSHMYQVSTKVELLKAQDLISGVMDIIMGLPEETEWDDGITDVYEMTTDLSNRMDKLIEEVERW